MALSINVSGSTTGTDPAQIASTVKVEIIGSNNSYLAVGVGMSAADVAKQLTDSKNTSERYIAELQTEASSLAQQLEQARQAAATNPTNLNQGRVKRLETEIAANTSKIATETNKISEANEALAYVNNGTYQADVDAQVKALTEAAPEAIATPDKLDTAAKTADTETTPDPTGTAQQDLTSNQDNKEAAQVAADNAAAAANSAANKAATAGAGAGAAASAAESRLGAAGVTKGAEPLSKNPSAPEVTVAGKSSKDRRVRISLAPQAPNVFYKDTSNELLKPLIPTDGVLFPIQPQITIGHDAKYQATDLTHSNFTFYNYTNSSIKPITLTGEFIVRNPIEGRYCVAAIRFLQAMTKMFNANDTANNLKGAPPMVARLHGLGFVGYDSLPVVITGVDVNFPAEGADLVSVVVKAGTTEEVVKIPTSFTITVNMNPVFSRYYATTVFGTQNYASGKVRLLGNTIVSPPPLAAPSPPQPPAAPATAGAGEVKPKGSDPNQAEPDKVDGKPAAKDAAGVEPAKNGDSSSDTSYEESTEKTTVTNADGSKTTVEKKTVNGKTVTTTTNTDKDGKVTTKVDDGSSGTGADKSTTAAGQTGSGGEGESKPSDQEVAKSKEEAKAKLEAEATAKWSEYKGRMDSYLASATQFAETGWGDSYKDNLSKLQAREQQELAEEETILAAAQKAGDAAAVQAAEKNIAYAKKSIAARQAKLDGGFPYGLTSPELVKSWVQSQPTYQQLTSQIQSLYEEMSDYNRNFIFVNGLNVPGSGRMSAGWTQVPPNVQIG